jgi:hypothetical protein
LRRPRWLLATTSQTGIATSSATARHAMPPANLRMLGDKYGMPLPAHRIAELIDGRDTARAHGSHEMPVWGEKLYEMGQGERGEYGIGEVIGKIIAYLDTIQDRRSAMR